MASARSEHLDILRNAIKMEEDGKRFFSEMAERARHPNARDMYASLVKQEQRHIEVLTEQLVRLEAGREWVAPSSVRSGSAAVPKVSVFAKEERGGLTVDPGVGELDVIRLGMEIEKRSIEYYRRAGAEVSGAKARQVFNWLIGEEAGHLAILQAEYDNRSRSGFYFDSPEFSLEVM